MMQLSPTKTTKFLTAFITIFLLCLNLHGWQTVSLDGFDKKLVERAKSDDKVLKLPGSFLLEHATHFYNRTYNSSKNCFFELSLDPFFEYDFVRQPSVAPEESRPMIKSDKRRFLSAGVFAQAHVQFHGFWIRAYDMIGKIAQSGNIVESETEIETVHASAFGADDVIIKLGYNFYDTTDHQCALYALSGIPTHRNLQSEVARLSSKFQINPDAKIKSNIEDNHALTVDSPTMGSKHYRVGGGFIGAFTLYRSAEDHCAFLCDIQYSYAFKSTYITAQDWTQSTGKFYIDLSPEHKLKSWGVKDYAKMQAQFTPGHSIDSWFAFYYKHNNWGLELGSVVSTMFGKKADFKFDNAKFDTISPRIKWLTPEIINFGIQPYVACSYNVPTKIVDLDLGVGAGYEYAHTTRKKLPNTFQGLNAWGNITLTF